MGGLTYFHLYTYGSQFLLRTDYTWLIWLMSFKEPEDQVARWQEKLFHQFLVQPIQIPRCSMGRC